MTLDEARGNVGRQVEYRPAHPALPAERGVISSVGERYVFVRYGEDLTAKATPPGDLTLVHAGPDSGKSSSDEEGLPGEGRSAA